MTASIPLRTDFSASDLRALAGQNFTIILLPSRSPELNPVENIWQ